MRQDSFLLVSIHPINEAQVQIWEQTMSETGLETHIVLIAGEHSGDNLGGGLMASLRQLHAAPLRFSGVGGALMEREGLNSLFPLDEIAVMGPVAILKRLPQLVRRVYQTVDACVAANPDVIVIIDSPEFTHPIAKRLKKRLPGVPILNYVSPSVWAWRSGRARKMARYIDHVLALLPFEPEVHAGLGGPKCSYVGHPLAEKIESIGAIDTAPLRSRLNLDMTQPTLAILPGSRPSEISRLIDIFGAALQRLSKRHGPVNILIPTLSHVRHLIEAATGDWPMKVHILMDEEDKFAAFRLSEAALAASGTVTLELAAAGTPMVVAYRVDPLAARLAWLVKVPSFVLPNLVIGRNAVPEFMQDECTAENLSSSLFDLLTDDAVRQDQLAALREVQKKLVLDHGTPSRRAAEIVLEYIGGQ